MAPAHTAYYDLLQVKPDATQDELASAYKKCALKLHPDKGGDPEQFKAMKAAYDVLRDPQKRQLYDTNGPAFVRAMDGEALDPEVMYEVVMHHSKILQRWLLCMLPLFAFLLLFPAVAFCLKWDGTVSWNWNVAFVPIWLAQLVVLLGILRLRSAFAATAGLDGEDEGEAEDRMASEKKKRHMRQVFSALACFLLLMIVQEAFIAARLQGYMDTSWIVVIIPYFFLEVVFVLIQLRTDVAADWSLLLLYPVWWAVLRSCTVSLLAAKADGRLTCAWLFCLMPVMVGAGIKLLWSLCRSRPRKRTVFRDGRVQLLEENEEEEAVNGSGFVGACIGVTFWLGTLILAAGKMDGWRVPSWLVFSPFYIAVSIVLCCCTCLACCGPTLVDAAMQNDIEQRESSQGRGSSEAQNLNQGAGTDYSTIPSDQHQPSPV